MSATKNFDIRNENVCVVGGAGFLGSHLVHHLKDDRDCTVLVIDNLSSGIRGFIPNRSTVHFEHTDITVSEHHLYKLFRQYGINFVFNYAASPYIPVSFERPLHVFGINATGAMHVINAAHSAGCKAILQVSSAEIYGSASYTDRAAITEDEPVTPHSTYGAAKAAIDFLVQARWREAKVPCIALRQFNCIGERETHPYVVPEIISQLARNQDWVEVDGQRYYSIYLGNNSIRDFLYAGDAVKMAVELLEYGEFGEVYNMGSESSIKIYDLACVCADLWGKRIEVRCDDARRRPWEIWALKSDNSKLYKTIPYRPTIDLKEALEKTIRYFQRNDYRWVWEK